MGQEARDPREGRYTRGILVFSAASTTPATKCLGSKNAQGPPPPWGVPGDRRVPH